MKMQCIFLATILVSLSCAAQKRVVLRSPGVPTELPNEPIPPLKEETPDFIRLDAKEDAQVLAAQSKAENDRLRVRFITCDDQFNADGVDAVKPCKDAVTKALNSISSEVELYEPKWIGPAGTIGMIDIKEIGVTPAEWKIIEDNDLFKFTSETVRGRTLQFLTGTKRPSINGHNFVETVLVKAYYGVTGIAGNFADFQKQIGVNVQKDFDERDSDLILMGMNESLITSNRQHRMIYRVQGTFGPLWCTNDTNDVNVAPVNIDGQLINQKNLTEAPFPVFARSKRVFLDDAGECLFIKPNGMIGAALFDAKFIRQDFAPTNIVQDTRSAGRGLSGTIQNARSCFGCHATGFIPIRDTIGNQIARNTSYNAADKELGRLFYKSAATGDAFFARDNSKYAKALDELNIDNQTEDPINNLTDKLRLEQNLKQVSGLLGITEDELTTGLNSSTSASAVLGVLLQPSGKVNLQQLIDGLPILIAELNLFQDDI